jgi:hypothetical protein
MTRSRIVSRHLACATLALTVGASGAFAEPPQAVDVAIHEEPPPRRILTLEWNPLLLITGRVSANIVIAPIDHHSLVLSPFYFSTETADIFVYNDAESALSCQSRSLKGSVASSATATTSVREGRADSSLVRREY